MPGIHTDDDPSAGTDGQQSQACLKIASGDLLDRKCKDTQQKSGKSQMKHRTTMHTHFGGNTQ